MRWITVFFSWYNCLAPGFDKLLGLCRTPEVDCAYNVFIEIKILLCVRIQRFTFTFGYISWRIALIENSSLRSIKVVSQLLDFLFYLVCRLLKFFNFSMIMNSNWIIEACFLLLVEKIGVGCQLVKMGWWERR